MPATVSNVLVGGSIGSGDDGLAGEEEQHSAVRQVRPVRQSSSSSTSSSSSSSSGGGRGSDHDSGDGGTIVESVRDGDDSSRGGNGGGGGGGGGLPASLSDLDGLVDDASKFGEENDDDDGDDDDDDDGGGVGGGGVKRKRKNSTDYSAKLGDDYDEKKPRRVGFHLPPGPPGPQGPPGPPGPQGLRPPHRLEPLRHPAQTRLDASSSSSSSVRDSPGQAGPPPPRSRLVSGRWEREGKGGSSSRCSCLTGTVCDQVRGSQPFLSLHATPTPDLGRATLVRKVKSRTLVVTLAVQRTARKRGWEPLFRKEVELCYCT